MASLPATEGLLLLDAQLIKTPLDTLQRNFRNIRKQIEKELTTIDSKSDFNKTIIPKINAFQTENERIVQNIQDRNNHLQQYNINSNTFQKTRINRLLIEYLLRKGYYKTAQQLINQKNLQELTDTQLYTNAHKITETLIKNKNCQVAIQWCNENKSALKKINVKELNI